MINLIPNEEKKVMIRDFYLRLLVVSFVIFAFAIFVASVAILPAYFISSTQKNLASEKLDIQKNESLPLVDQETATAIKDLKSKLILIENASKNKFVVSEKAINNILSKKMSDIKINQIHYDENDPVKGRVISINGTAPSRERLLLFRQALEESGLFAKVDLPISNFIKGSDIIFYLSLSV